ncbi:MarR family transcriptional regulator [Cupriavidus sp. 30B13]|uniref:MarR family transcriptional regulator n=1 Tax=Cupriavidus sp. 30B13 TaxID=3384241 RepID=UPI003B91320E
MRPKALEPTESVLLALMASVREWQSALDQTLSEVGLDYPGWLLLRAIRQEEFVRHAPYAGLMPISVAQSEAMLGPLQAHGWIALDASGQPFIPAAALARVERVYTALKALHSVSLAPFSSAERAALTASLLRMKATLHDHCERRGRQAGRQVEMQY